MATPSGSTAKFGLPFLEETDVPDVATASQLLAQGVENIIATAYEGTAAARPAAGVFGRWYYATDTTAISFDAGSAWITMGTVTPTGTFTLTNKRITPRVVSVTQSATPAINTDNGDIFTISGLAQAITSLSSGLTGTPAFGDMFQSQITDNGHSGGWGITLGSSFVAGPAPLPTQTVSGVTLFNLFQWNGTHWLCLV